MKILFKKFSFQNPISETMFKKFKLKIMVREFWKLYLVKICQRL